jgi:hypothetical protein
MSVFAPHTHINHETKKVVFSPLFGVALSFADYKKIDKGFYMATTQQQVFVFPYGDDTNGFTVRYARYERPTSFPNYAEIGSWGTFKQNEGAQANIEPVIKVFTGKDFQTQLINALFAWCADHAQGQAPAIYKAIAQHIQAEAKAKGIPVRFDDQPSIKFSAASISSPKTGPA